MHNMEKCGRGKGRPQGCSLRSHRRRRLAPLPPPFSPAPMLRHVVYASLLHFGVESADIYVQPSLHEGLCISVLEAMAQGMLVVASDVGGIKQYGHDRNNMIKIKGETHMEIAEGLAWLIALYQVLPYLAAYRTLKPDLDFGFARRPSRPVAYQSLSFCDASHV